MRKNQYLKKYLLKTSITPLLFLSHCSKNIDPVTKEKVLVEPNITVKTREFADKGGGIFGDFGKNAKSSTFEFSTSNTLWRATLKSLDFLPIVNADYSGGIIIYDWYSDNNSDEQIKVTVRFLNNEVRSDSLEIQIHKKKCTISTKCITTKIDDALNREIKDKILNSARLIKIEEAKKEKK
jgi:hypothetical protein